MQREFDIFFFSNTQTCEALSVRSSFDETRCPCDVRFNYRREFDNDFARLERVSRCKFVLECSLTLPRKREKLYCVCLVDDASGGTDHIDWPASVECTDYTRVRGRDGRILAAAATAAEPPRRIREPPAAGVLYATRRLAPRAMRHAPRTRVRIAEPRVHARYTLPPC
jgi:hypothetical protein